VTGREQELLARTQSSGAISVYCLAALVAEEAQRTGCDQFARSLEKLLEEFLTSLPRDQRMQALKLSYDLAVAGCSSSAEPAPRRLKLVYSRD
jgi:hypothetical protein